MLESLQLDMHRYFHAKLCLAECKENREGAKVAAAYLEEIKREIEKLEKSGQFRNASEHLGPMAPQLQKAIQPRLDLLMRDWGEQGSYFWLKQQIDRRIAALSLAV